MNKSLAVILFSIASTSFAQTPERLSIGQLIEKTDETQDPTYMTLVFFRCNALYSIASELILRDFGDSQSELVETLKSSSDINLMLAIRSNEAVRESRGLQPMTEEERMTYALGMYEDQADYYTERMSANYRATGEYFSDDPELREEFETCGMVTETLRPAL